MKIVKLTAENFKRLKAVEITPDGNMVIVRGENAQGKTSVLSAIWAALGGKKCAPDRPIRDDGDKAEITLDIGDYVVTRVFTPKDTYLTVKTRDGAKVANPQQILDGLFNAIAFDPLSFSGMNPQEQARMLAKIVGVDFDDLNAKRKTLYDLRTDCNRDVNRLAGECAGITSRYPEATKADREPVDVSALNMVYQKAQAVANAVDMAKSRITTHSEVVRRLESDKASLLQQIKAIDAEIAEEMDVIAESQSVVKDTIIPDIQAILDRIATAGEHNKKADDLKRLDLLDTALRVSEQETSRLSAEITEIDNEKSDMVTGASLPVNGLEFDENGVTFKGTPFKECADSEKLKISTVIAMRLNPTLRVLRITNGSLLDNKSMQTLDDLTKNEDFQLWIERVDSSKDGPGILIEDGEVKSANDATR